MIGKVLTVAAFLCLTLTAFTVNAQPAAPAPQTLPSRNMVMPAPGVLRGLLHGGAGWLGAIPNPEPDANEPDKAAWQVFIAICKAASTQQQVGLQSVTTNNAVWETWADDPLTFPSTVNPAQPPTWPATAQTFPLKRLTLPTQNAIRQLLMQKAAPAVLRKQLLDLQRAHPEISISKILKGQNAGAPFQAQFKLVQAGGGEEVRRNKASFDFIIANKLWYTQGLADAFKAGNVIN